MRSLLLLTLVASLLLPGVATCDNDPVKHLKVAAVLGLTGAAAYHSQGIRNGLTLAKEELEGRGWSIDLRYDDDQTLPSKTVSAFQYLLSENYKYFIGPTWSFQANAVRSLLSRNTAVALVPAGSSEINGGFAEGMFNLCPSRIGQEPYISTWLKERGFKRAFILTANGDWGEVHAKVFRAAVQSSGGTVVGEEHFDYGVDVTTVGSLLTKAVRAGADLIMTTGGGGDVANVVRARNVQKIGVSVLSTNDIRDAVHQNLLSRSELNQVYSVGLTVSPEFERRYRVRFGDDASLYADRGYDALMVLAYAIEHTDGSVSEVHKYLKSRLVYPGVIGQIAFDKSGDVDTGRYQIVPASE